VTSAWRVNAFTAVSANPPLALTADLKHCLGECPVFTIPMGLLAFQTGKKQTKTLPWIPTCKTGQPKSFGYKSKSSLEACLELCTACLTSASPSLISNDQVMICLTGIPWAALKDVRLTDDALLMPMHNNCVQRWLASRATLLVCVGWI
jgi:hypothetical protein